MKSSICSFLLSAALLPISLFGSSMQITFTAADGKLASTDKKLKPCDWLKDKAETALYAKIPGNINEWNHASFEFIPEKDGMVNISLKGPNEKSKPLDQWYWVVYDNIKVNGKLLPNGGFEDGFKNWRHTAWGKLSLMPQIVEDPMMVKSGKRAVRVWHNGPVNTKFLVKAGEKVLVQLHYMPTNHFNSNEKDVPLSLEKHANRAFADEKAGDGKGGWSDQGPENDLRLFDASRKQLGNVSFAFPKAPKQVVVFDSPHDKTGLTSITLDIPENAKGKYLYLLHAACWVPKDGIIGELVFTGADGKSKKVPVKIGKDIRDWFNPLNLPNGLVVWKMRTPNAAKGLYLSKFEVPVKDLKSIQITGFGNAVWILCGATLSTQNLNLLTANWTPGKEYLPADMAEKNTTLPGSILDISSGSPKKIDRVVIGKNGNFEFAGEPGKTVRFRQIPHHPVGWPLTLQIRKMKREEVHRMIDDYLDEASLRGYNMVRTHMIDGTIFNFGKNNEPDPVTLDAMDYFFYSAKKHNIYINLNLAAYVLITHWEKSPKETPNDRKTKILIGDPRIRQMWIDLTKFFLCRVNPYTKTMLKDEPMLVMVEPYNELAFGLMTQIPSKEAVRLLHNKFLDFLEKKLGRKVSDLPKNPFKNQGKYRKEWIEFHYLCIRDTMQFFRNELEKLGVKAPIAQYNVAWHRQHGDVRSEFDDVVIKNAYFAHPSNFSRIGSRCPQGSALLTAGAYFRKSTSARFADRPMVMTEYNHCSWNKYEYEQVLFPAYAAFQGYAGLAMHEIDLHAQNRIANVFASSLMDRSHDILTYLLFQRGDVTPSKHLTQLSIPKSSLFAEDALDAISQEQTRGVLLTRFAVKYEDTPRPAMIAALPEPKPDVVIPLTGSSKVKQSTMFVEAQDDKSSSFDFGKFVKELKAKKILSDSNRTDAANGIYESDTGELLLNAPQKYMTIKTAKTEVIASEEPTAETLDCMKKVSSSIPATVAISAMDGKTLAESGKMLLFYLTEVTNTGMELSGDRVTLKNLGKLPVLLRTGKLDLKLKLAPGKQYTLYPLRSDGFRRKGIPLTTKDGITEISLDTAILPNGVAFYFELEGNVKIESNKLRRHSMHQLDKFKKMFEESSAEKPFSFDYDGEKLDLSSVKGVIERKNDRQFRMIYDVIPNLLRVILEVNTFDDFPVIEYTPYVENIGKTDTGIISDFSSLDYAVQVTSPSKKNSKTNNGFESDRITIRYFHGAHATALDFLPERTEVIFVRSLQQKSLEFAGRGGRGSSSFLPYLGIDTDTMNGINLAIGWNSSWKFRAEGDGDSSGRVRCGMKYSHFRLHPGEKLLQPGILLHFREGKSIRDSQNEFRRFILKHNSPRNSKGELFKPPVSLLLWGGFETKKQLNVLKIVSEKQIPYEEWWIDAGWMGASVPCPHPLENSSVKSDWPNRVGTWEFNRYAHPQGFRPIADAVHQHGLRFLVWFETERIHAKSEARILTEHPEWLLWDKKADPNQDKTENYLLNLGIPEAREYIFKTVCEIIDREGIDDYREDFNMNIENILTSEDAPDRIGVAESKYVEGFYQFWGDLRKRYPDMFIDNCASGGKRLDYKTAALSFPLCQSDYATYHVYEEESIQLENLYLDDWIPLHGTLSNGEADPYHAFSGLGCGYSSKIWEFNGREPKPGYDYARHKKIVEWGKLLRDLHMAGDVYPQVEFPDLDMRLWNGQQIHLPEENRGAVVVFRRKQSPEADFQLHLSGIDPEREYDVEFFDGEIRKIFGRELASLTIHLDQPRSFRAFTYKAV